MTVNSLLQVVSSSADVDKVYAEVNASTQICTDLNTLSSASWAVTSTGTCVIA